MSHPDPTRDYDEQDLGRSKKSISHYRKKHGTVMEHFGKIATKAAALKKMRGK